MWRKNLDLSQSIFALASGSLPSAVAIIKLSGPEAFGMARRIFSPVGKTDIPVERAVHFGKLRSLTGEFIDDCVAVTFVGPHSHTGEDTIEFHCHGSVAIVSEVERTLLDCGARVAERGEFSYRAVLNGKAAPASLDFLGDVFLAREKADLRRIYGRRDGGLEQRIAELRSDLIQLQAILDTAVDFSDEYSHVVAMAARSLEKVIHECSTIIQRYSNFRSARCVPRIVLAGRPNAGKSSLFNALLCRYRAIVHDAPGTTRDVIEEDVEIEGRLWKLVDTAGVRSTSEVAEQKGLELGMDYLTDCDFWILVVDGRFGAQEAEFSLLQKFGRKPHLVLWNKCDETGWKAPEGRLADAMGVSALTGANLPSVWENLKTRLPELSPIDNGLLPTATQAARLRGIVSQLESMQSGLSEGVPPEFIAEQNRSVLHRLEEVVGEVGPEDVLDRIFNEFCIGK